MTKAPTLIVRADASVRWGTGHVMRCLALAQAWQDLGGRALFLMAETTDAVGQYLRLQGIEVVSVAGEPAGHDDVQQLKQAATRHGAEWVILDGYHFDANYQHELKSDPLKLLWVDDQGTRGCTADLVLNQNSNAHESMYPERGSYTRLLLGTSYVLLRRQFLAACRQKREIPSRAQRLLITMGGSDPDNLTALAMQALRFVKTAGLRSIIVAGASNPHFDDLQRSASAAGDAIELRSATSSMPELMQAADMALIAGGGTLWELLFMGCPVLSFARNHVQAEILRDLHERNVVHHLGAPEICSPESVAAAIDKLAESPERRSTMSALGQLEVDGEGARRVCDAMRERN